ncbi:MAG: diguanylate cyclase domain-containing protein [Coriobacteriia bacterium]
MSELRAADRPDLAERAERDRDMHATLNALLRLSLEPLPLEDVLAQALDMLLDVPWLALERRGSVFLTPDDAPDVLVMKAQRGLHQALLTACAEVPFGRCLCGLAAESGEVVFAGCVDHKHQITYSGMIPHGHWCVPVTSRGRVLGVVNLYVREHRLRDPAIEDFILAVANTLAGLVERKRAEEERERVGRLASTVLDSMVEAISLVDVRDFRIVDCNSAFLEQVGKKKCEVLGRACHEVTHGTSVPCRQPNHQCPVVDLLRDGRPAAHEHSHRDAQGGERYVTVMAFPVRDSLGRIVQAVHVARDVTAQKVVEKRLEGLAYRDALTGLPNRILLADRLAQMLSLGKRHGHSVGLLFVDLDGFKQVNDRQGHAVGDLLLKEVAARLAGEVRESDTIARVGGDEFVLVLSVTDGLRGVTSVAERLIRAVMKPIIVDQVSLNVGASVGVAVFPLHGSEPALLMRRADEAMYRAKRLGRGRFEVWSE